MYRHLIFAASFAVILPVMAQSTQSGEAEYDESPMPVRPLTGSTQPGQTADSSVGQAGQRQSWSATPLRANPMGRISNRIQNRVQARIRNRIDRSYDPQGNAKAPFAVAEEASKPRP